jgi:hypothetical protein
VAVGGGAHVGHAGGQVRVVPFREASLMAREILRGGARVLRAGGGRAWWRGVAEVGRAGDVALGRHTPKHVLHLLGLAALVCSMAGSVYGHCTTSHSSPSTGPRYTAAVVETGAGRQSTYPSIAAVGAQSSMAGLGDPSMWRGGAQKPVTQAVALAVEGRAGYQGRAR